MSAPDPYLPGSGDDAYRVAHYDLELDYRPATNALTGRAVLTVLPLVELSSLSLDLVGLGVDGVRVGGRPSAGYRLRGGRLVVRLTAPVRVDAVLEVEVRWSGSPRPRRGRWGEVGFEELTDGVLVAGQPDGAPTWFPCNDRLGHKASFRTSVRVDAGYTVVAPGELVSVERGGSRTTWVHEQVEPTPPYLATLQIGRYEQHRLAGEPVQRLFAPAGLRVRARHDTARSPEMMALFVERFGPYPFGSYTVVVTGDDLEIPLEAQGMSVLGANHVDGNGGSERLVAHELAHQWFGNSLTAQRWRDLWLHEGFACYAEWLWSEASGGQTADVLAATAWQRMSELPQDLLLADPGPELMFDDRVYKRGALALHTLRRSIGDDRFFSLLQAWVADHRHGSVTTQDLLDHVAARAGETAAAQLRRWVCERALPPLNR